MPEIKRIAVFSLAYSAAGAAASLLQSQAGTVGLYWPAAGIGVGGLLVLPKRAWPGFLAALLAAQVAFNLFSDQDLIALLTWPIANLTGHLLVAVLIRRWDAERLETVHAVAAFSAAALAGTIPAAVLGAIGSPPPSPRGASWPPQPGGSSEISWAC